MPATAKLGLLVNDVLPTWPATGRASAYRCAEQTRQERPRKLGSGDFDGDSSAAEDLDTLLASECYPLPASCSG